MEPPIGSEAPIWAGRYEDALRVVDRQSAESRPLGAWLQRALIYAALGRSNDARAAVTDPLARYPTLTVQGWVSRPDINPAGRPKYEDLMRKAGFPVCAKPEELARYPNPVPYAECATEVTH